MTHSIQEITEKISALPESMQQEVFNFIEIMQLKAARQTSLGVKHEPNRLGEQVSTVNWHRPEETDAWVNY